MLVILTDLSILFFNLVLFCSMITLAPDERKNRMIMISGCLFIFFFYTICVYVLNYPQVLCTLLCMSLPSLVLFLCISKYRDGRFFLCFALADTLSLLVASIGKYLILLDLATEITSLAITILLFIILLILWNDYTKQLRFLMTEIDQGWNDMAITAMLIYFSLGFINAYPTPIAERLEYIPVFLVFGLIAISFYVVFIHSMQKTQKIYDQNKKLQQEQEIYRIAYVDALTGLFNRAAYIKKINVLERERSSWTSLCCVMLDMNHLKTINDNQGHAAGDFALRQIAEVLCEVFPSNKDNLFRIGGDEFCLLLCDASIEQVSHDLLLLNQQLKQHSEVSGLMLSVAAGTAWVKQEESIESALIRADNEMYTQKRNQRK